MKTSDNGYVHIKLFQLFGEKCIPTGKTRTTENGEVEAEFFLISSPNPERLVWLKRNEIY